MKLVAVKRSPRPSKKLVAIFEGPARTVHFGAKGYGDFIQYSRRDPALARAKRAEYLARHGATQTWRDPAAPGTLSRYILWEKPTLQLSIASFKRRFGV